MKLANLFERRLNEESEVQLYASPGKLRPFEDVLLDIQSSLYDALSRRYPDFDVEKSHISHYEPSYYTYVEIPLLGFYDRTTPDLSGELPLADRFGGGIIVSIYFYWWEDRPGQRKMHPEWTYKWMGRLTGKSTKAGLIQVIDDTMRSLGKRIH